MPHETALFKQETGIDYAKWTAFEVQKRFLVWFWYKLTMYFKLC